MQKILTYIALLLFPFASLAQKHSNQWIDYRQTYIKMHVTAQGVYKITGANLRNLLGSDFISLTAANMQLLHAGKQVPVYVNKVNKDGPFADSDYIEFYAKSGNTGWLDTAVYYNYKPLNHDYSLYNDTAAYFLTFPTITPGEQYNSTENTDFLNYTPLSYCFSTIRRNFNASYNITAQSSHIHDGEGWGDTYFDEKTSPPRRYTLATENFSTNTGALSTIRFGMAGVSETIHDISVGISTASSQIRFDTTYRNFNAVHKTIRTDAALLASTQFEFQSYPGDAKVTDKNSVAYIEITYPHSYDFKNLKEFAFSIPKQASSDAFVLLEVSNFDGGDKPVLYIPEIKQRIPFTKNGTKYQVLVPNVNKELQCYALNQANIKAVGTTRWKLVSSKNTSTRGKLLDFNNDINQGDYIIIAHQSQWAEAQQYAAFRDSSGKKTLLIDVAELYDQFAYGINKHPQAIHEFIDFATKQWKIKPQNVLLLGKGYKITDFRKNTSLYAQTLIPPMGYPASDLLFTITNHKVVSPSEYRASVNIGRIASQNSTELINYLNKVRLHEQQTPDVWMKTVMHFGGGSNKNEQTLIQSYLREFENTISDTLFGANVSTFLKSSSNVFEHTEPDIIRKNMNAGTSILNFFGHASGSGFDQNIDDPILFDNIGKYPLIIANSCYSGDMFSPNPLGFSEKWIVSTPEKGAIGFIANVTVGIPAYLSMFTTSLLRNIAYRNYGKPIGESMRLSVTELCQKWNGFDERINSILSLSYHGDPAVFIHGFELPDFEIPQAGITFNPQVVSTDIRNFTANVTIANNGRLTTDSCLVRIKAFSVERNNPLISRDTIVSRLFAHNTTEITFNTLDFTAGNYTIEATVLPISQISRDSANKIPDKSKIVYIKQPDGDSIPHLRLPELNGTNNTARVNLFITAQDILPVFPPNFSIIPYDTVSLVAVAVDPMNPPKELHFVIDTTINFNSDLRYPRTITDNSESVLIWKPNITLLENVTYYWRIWSEDSSAWRINSFTYEPQKTGWAQQNRGQFGSNTLSSNNTLSNVNYDIETQQYSFAQSSHVVSTYSRNMEIPRPAGGLYPDSYYYDNRFMLDNMQMQTSGFPLGTPAFHVAVFDSVTSNTWKSDRGKYGQSNFGVSNGEIRNFFAFPSNNATYQQSMANFLNDTIPIGNFILVYSFGNVKTVIPELKSAFSRLGATIPANDESENYSYIFFVQKGNTSSVQEAKSTTVDEILTLSTHFEAKRTKGTITTPFIGPADSIHAIMWGDTLLNKGDASEFAVMAVLPDQSNNIQVDIPFGKDTLYRADTLINAELTPFVQLQNSIQDEIERTPPKLNFWKVYFDPVGDLSINVDRNFYFHTNNIAQGDTLRKTIGAQNISYTPMDSVLVHFEIRNSAQELIVSEYQRLSPAGIQQTVFANFKHSTQFMPSDDYTLRVEFNPVNPETGEYDQLENTHFNNVIYRQFHVYADKTKPSLDVTFDNRHVLNGDYVSTEPLIRITLFDENQFFPLRDTSLFTITIRNTSTNREERYYFAGDALQFFPATGSSNSCVVLFTPTLADGSYELTVTARDENGNTNTVPDENNKIQVSPYIIRFQVAAKARISTLFNFPNPAHNYTTFRVVLSGQKAPTDAKISIYSLQGALVHEIPLHNLHIGTNDIPFYWNSSVKNLAPGVYTYRLTFPNQDEFGVLPNTSKNSITSGKQKLIIR
ncbi:MAG: C25 family cysteine peptidase [Bacteroidales bacterium]|nr:C25 family cysteine peptidase [Bacteroidales bacterium]